MCELLERCANVQNAGAPVPLLVALVDGDDVVFLELKKLSSSNFSLK